jgi:hypothetical protein
MMETKDAIDRIKAQLDLIERSKLAEQEISKILWEFNQEHGDGECDQLIKELGLSKLGFGDGPDEPRGTEERMRAYLIHSVVAGRILDEHNLMDEFNQRLSRPSKTKT